MKMSEFPCETQRWIIDHPCHILLLFLFPVHQSLRLNQSITSNHFGVGDRLLWAYPWLFKVRCTDRLFSTPGCGLCVLTAITLPKDCCWPLWWPWHCRFTTSFALLILWLFSESLKCSRHVHKNPSPFLRKCEKLKPPKVSTVVSNVKATYFYTDPNRHFRCRTQTTTDLHLIA